MTHWVAGEQYYCLQERERSRQTAALGGDGTWRKTVAEGLGEGWWPISRILSLKPKDLEGCGLKKRTAEEDTWVSVLALHDDELFTSSGKAGGTSLREDKGKRSGLNTWAPGYLCYPWSRSRCEWGLEIWIGVCIVSRRWVRRRQGGETSGSS